MIRRRTLIKAGLTLPLAPALLGACGRPDPNETTSFYERGIYLSENFGPVDIESTVTNMQVTGTIPGELTGRFLRNGPNPIDDPDPDSHHWFTGEGMVHGLRLEDGRADWYRNRWVRSKSVIESLGENANGRNLGDSPNTHVIGHAGKTWAIVEAGAPPVELTYELDTVGHNPGWGSYTAHPKIDPDTGELHAICYDFLDNEYHVNYVVMDLDANVSKIVKLPLPGMSMIHDMSLTKNYVVIYDLPVTFSFMALATGAQFPFRWNNDYEARVGLLPRNGEAKDIIWSSVSQNYSFHPMNAYEDTDGNVVIDICRYDRMFVDDTNGPFGDSVAKLDRWTVNPKLRTVSEERIDERGQEFPRCHPDLNSREYRYGYSLAVKDKSFPSIYKHDMKTGESSSFEFGPGRHGAEPIFIPKQSAQSEDDGYLMTYVFDEQKNASELIIVDALDLNRPALAQVHLPVRVPYGFHGSWIPDDDVSAE
ncbi:MAG: carotenoid oxygenase family protein [bacterium]|nr:carotenoid oxygenase [Gammaproteobacteria bacterium]HIL98394.1 carotenoid oxygenase [Pseudomonadales bacterium]